MRNYFKALEQPTTVSRETLTNALAIGSAVARKITPRQRVDADDILLNDERREVYVNMVELYEAMYIASARLNDPIAVDTHHWSDRLADFDTATDDSAPLSAQE